MMAYHGILKMLTRIINSLTLMLLLSSEVRSDLFSESSWRDMDNKTIDITNYCANKTCVAKCCPKGQLLNATSAGLSKCITFENNMAVNFMKYSAHHRYSSLNDVVETNRTAKIHFLFVQNDLFSDSKHTIYTFYWCDIKILEDGSLYSEKCDELQKLEYCVDFYIKNETFVLAYKVVVEQDDTETKNKEYFTIAGLITSSFFMVLVLLVYSILPELRRIIGMVLVPYLLTLTCVFMLRVVQLLYLLSDTPLGKEECQILSPAVYYFMISSFFWLNVMSYDLWMTIRSLHVRQSQEELAKLLRYGLYAWGIPLLLTVVDVAIDRSSIMEHSDYRPPFDSCMADTVPTLLHVHLPIGIMTAVNWIMFILTSRHICLVKSAVKSTTEGSDTKDTKNRFAVYIQISILMGVGWILELIPKQELILHVLINTFNLFSGVWIFIVIVCKKPVIIMLCKRFRIKNKCVDNLLATSQHSTSNTARTPICKERRNSQTEDRESTRLTSKPAETS